MATSNSILPTLENIRNESMIVGTPEGKKWEYPAITKKWELKDYAWYPSYGITTSVSNLIGKLPASINTMFDFISDPNKSIKTTPRIKVFEFEPEPYYNVLIDIYKNLYDKFSSYLSSGVGGNTPDFTQIFQDIRNKFSLQSLQKALSDSGIASNLSSPQNLVMNIPGAFYSGMVAGKFLRSVELPYYGPHYLHARGEAGWSQTTIQSHLGGMSDVLKRFGLGGLNLPLYPQFQLEGFGPECDDVSCEINLYNDTLYNLVQNTLFINAFIPGAFWIQSGLLQRGSNFFQVEIPGRCIYFLCKMDAEVTCVGKSRALHPQAKDNVNWEKLPPIITDNFEWSNAVPPVPPTNIVLIPDIYKLKLKFVSIMPNNFNAYLFSVLNWDKFRAKQGGRTTFAVADFLNAFVNPTPLATGSRPFISGALTDNIGPRV